MYVFYSPTLICSPIYDTKDWSPSGDVYVGGKLFFLHFWIFNPISLDSYHKYIN